MDFQIRKATEVDVPVILRLINELAVFEKEPDAVEITEETLFKYGFSEEAFFHCYVAEFKKEVVGMALFYPRFSTWKGKTIHLEDGTIYSINEGNYVHFPQGVKNYIKYCQAEEDGRPYTSRYIGSLVSDFHRNMIKGGIYMYPKSSKANNGKLRLLYECNPMAFIAEQAGGKASDGFTRILDLQPTELHERAPFFCGSKNMVEKAEEFMQKAEGTA